MAKTSDLFSGESLTRFDELLSIVGKSNSDFAKASTDANARIECKVQNFDIAKNLDKVGKKVYLHLPLKMRILSKGTKASLILMLGVRIELCETHDRKIGWCDYKFDSSKFENSIKSSNCDGVSDSDLIEYFFTVVSTMQFYPFDEEIKSLMDFCDLEQDRIKHEFDVFTYVEPVQLVEEPVIDDDVALEEQHSTTQDETSSPDLLDLIA